ncbi:MAG TPA: aspartate carbamoyltransferase [Nitrososphaerales archaeon]|nr:aspartate carbamoyltransferase [Nitrososphaerales archaeon]
MNESDFVGRDVVSIWDFSREELEFIFDRTSEIEKSGSPRTLEGKLVALLFYEPSTRTHSTFEVAAQRLGCATTGFSAPDKSSVAKGETLHDTIRMYEGYGADCIVVRHNLMGASRFAAEVASVPLISGGDGSREHPTQAMVDLYAMRKTFGKIDGLRVGILGDLKYGRTASSLCYGLSNYDVEISLIAPDLLAARKETLAALAKKGVKVRSTSDVKDVLGSLDVLYVTRIQKERIPDPTEYERVRGLYKVDLELLRQGKKGLKVMHPLPRLDELANEIDGTEYAGYFTQAAAGVPLRMALLRMVVS